MSLEQRSAGVTTVSNQQGGSQEVMLKNYSLVRSEKIHTSVYLHKSMLNESIHIAYVVHNIRFLDTALVKMGIEKAAAVCD